MTMKKFASMVLALVLVMALTVPAYAVTLKIDSNSDLKDNTYCAYQVFTGKTVTVDNKDKFGVTGWGNGVDAEKVIKAIITDVAEDEIAAYVTDPASVAAEMAKLDGAELAKKLQACVNAGNKIAFENGQANVEDGYYLVLDETNIAEGATDKAKSAFILKTGKGSEIVITPKGEIPTIEKKINQDGNKVDVIGTEIGKEITFEITTTFPSALNLAAYDTYKYVITDEMDKGLTFVANSLSVHLETATGPVLTGYIGGTFDTDNKMEINFADLKTALEDKSYAECKIVTVYKAKLNANAVIDGDGNVNGAHLTYSNNPSSDGTGKTNDDYVVAFTFKIPVLKVDGENHDIKLDGVTFKLYKLDDSVKKYAQVANDKFVGWVDESNATTLKTNDNGVFAVEGLAAGTYYLDEIATKEGYNVLTADVKVELIATPKAGLDVANWVGNANGADLYDVTVKVNNGNPEANVTIENNKGATLPETGGIGTTIFYVVGGLLVLAAVVLLVTKRRMGAEN